MVLKLPWYQKWISWAFKNDIFHFFENFWGTRLKQFSGKAKQGIQNGLTRKLIIGRVYKMVLRLRWGQKWMFWTFDNGIFYSSPNYWVTKLKPFSGKAKKSLQNCLNPKLAIRGGLENGFQGVCRSKTNVLSVWKW